MRHGIHTVGSTGDSYHTMAEAFDRLSKRELIYPKDPWTGHEAVEFDSTGYVYVTPAEFGDGHDRPVGIRRRGGYPMAGAVTEPGGFRWAGRDRRRDPPSSGTRSAIGPWIVTSSEAD